MRYYLIVGEASGDLHASELMKQLAAIDPEATFRFFGGDLMQAQGGECVMHYKSLAYMIHSRIAPFGYYPRWIASLQAGYPGLETRYGHLG